MEIYPSDSFQHYNFNNVTITYIDFISNWLISVLVVAEPASNIAEKYEIILYAYK